MDTIEIVLLCIIVGIVCLLAGMGIMAAIDGYDSNQEKIKHLEETIKELKAKEDK